MIGGGITGAGVALDAATRGYSVALVEKGDYARGTSSRSSKLVHGGLRYLQNFDLGLVREALLERQINGRARAAPRAAAAADRARVRRRAARPARRPRAEHVRRDGGRPAAPLAARPPPRATPGRPRGLEPGAPPRDRRRRGGRAAARARRPRDPTGGYLFYDCQTDDVRLVLTVLARGRALRRGGRQPARGDRAAQDAARGGARVRDAESGDEFEVRAANVVNATGVWADRLRPDELHDEAEVPVIRPSRGTHIVLAGARLPVRAGAIVPGRRRAHDLRAAVARPDADRHDRQRLRRRHRPRAARPTADVEYLLDARQRVLRAPTLGRGDVAGAYAGVRPLISTGDPKKSVDISRKAELYETSSGMITITGGKLTTWRRMAKLTVDRIVERDGRDAPCRTHEIPLGMAGRRRRAAARRGRAGGRLRAARRPLRLRRARRAARSRPSAASWPQPILPGQPDLLAEAALRRAARAGAHASATCCCAARGSG